MIILFSILVTIVIIFCLTRLQRKEVEKLPKENFTQKFVRHLTERKKSFLEIKEMLKTIENHIPNKDIPPATIAFWFAELAKKKFGETSNIYFTKEIPFFEAHAKLFISHTVALGRLLAADDCRNRDFYVSLEFLELLASNLSFLSENASVLNPHEKDDISAELTYFKSYERLPLEERTGITNSVLAWLAELDYTDTHPEMFESQIINKI